ncbi:MAG: T9SS type A sorting domain-containing protein [Flavobacteriales bacterium]|nr:T9SS type A sorting domain-containing protein [Flavobacteriales bacterium]
MKSILTTLFLGLFALASLPSFAQCNPGEVEISMIMYTDPWGYENYWQIVPSGNDCGDGTIVWGGNDMGVGCSGTGNPEGVAGEYPSNSVINVDPFCMSEGTFLDLIFVDSYGDGGLTIEIYEDGSLSYVYYGTGDGNTWTFEVGNPPVVEFDSPCGALELTVDGGAVMMDNTGAIASVSEVTPGGGNCGVYGIWCEGAVTNSIWASFVAPEDGSVYITTCNEGTEADTQLALYSFEDCLDMSTFTLVSANDDMPGGCSIANGFSSEMYSTCLIPGDTYLIQLDGWNGSVGAMAISVETYVPETPQATAAVSSINCPLNKGEQGDGFILPYVFGWGSDFTVEWTGPFGYSSSDKFIYDLNGGVYTAVMTNACGSASVTAEFTVNEPAPFQASFDAADMLCPLSGDGFIEATISGGTPGYSYYWTGPDDFIGNTEDLENLNAGVYQLQLTDDHDCIANWTVNMSVDEPFSFDLGADVIICDDEQYMAVGPAGFFYEWQDGSINQFYIIDGSEVGPGTYTLILDAYNDDGCAYTDAQIVTVWNCTGVEEWDAEAIALYPNPANDRIWLENLPAGQNLRLQIIDFTGKVVSDEQLQQVQGRVELPLSDEMAPGMYSVRVMNAEYQSTFKFVKE